MTTPGVDYSFSRPGGAALAAAGKRFACRYLAYSHAPIAAEAKFLTAPEVADLHAHGIAIVANFESTSGRALMGGAAGQADAADALVAMQGLGFPINRPCYFSVDTNVTATDYPALDAYFAAVNKVFGGPELVGVYGEYDLINHLLDAGLARWAWQTAAVAWSPAGVPNPRAHIVQGPNGQSINGSAVDFDRSAFNDFGQWPVEDNVDKAVIPPAVGDFSPGAALYRDADRTILLVKDWSDYKNSPTDGYIRNVGIYGIDTANAHKFHAPNVAVRLDSGTGYVGADHLTNFRVNPALSSPALADPALQAEVAQLKQQVQAYVTHASSAFTAATAAQNALLTVTAATASAVKELTALKSVS